MIFLNTNTRRITSKARIAVMALIVTFSSNVFREYVTFVSGWCGKRVNGVTSIQSLSMYKSSRQFHRPGDRIRLLANSFQNESTRNFDRVNYGRKSFQSDIRNLSGQADHNNEEEEFDHTCNNSSEHQNNKSRDTNSSEASQITLPDDVNARETVGSVLSINPEDVDIYERTDQRRQQQMENEFDNKNLRENGLNSPFSNRNFIEMFRGSANYIASHRNSLAIFHIPGDLMDENPTGFRDLMNDISLSWLLGMKIVIVAGCRFQINKRYKEESQGRTEHMGMVVTDKESLRIVKEEAGYVRFEVERQLARALKGGSSWACSRSNSNGTDDDGVGEGNVVSGNFYSAQPFGVLDGVDYKYSGFVRRMETKKIHQVHQNRDIVLLTSLGFSPTGEVFNVNSEYLASYAAVNLGANKIIYFLGRDAALKHKIHGSIIPHLRVNDGRKLLEFNGVRMETKGFVYFDNCPFDHGAERLFLTKMGWGMNALEAGVKRVHLISPNDGGLLQELYTRDGSGTMISGDLYDGINRATVDDVTAIYDVITPLVEKGILVERTKAELERDIELYHVYTRDGLLVASGQLKMFEDGYAEIGCLVVNPLYRAKGRGDAMLGYLGRLCVEAGATNLFVLSTQAMEWFIERGFDEVGVDLLPPSRQVTYNYKRGSKIYMKKINSVRDLDANELFWDR